MYDNPPDNTETVVVAMIDSGVDLEHPDLAGRIWTNAGEIPDNSLDDDHNGYIDDVTGWNFEAIGGQQATDPRDTFGHGTHCSGTIAVHPDNGLGVGGVMVADCEIMALKTYPIPAPSYVGEAIVYAADNGADVINLSLGGPYPSTLLEDALEYTYQRGVVICAAAGNYGVEMDFYPASYQTVIAVGTSTSLDEVWEWSNYGEYVSVCVAGHSILSLRGDSGDYYAPCEPDVHVIQDAYYLSSGTSMACPHVVGIAAYLRSVSPGVGPPTARQIIESSADDVGSPRNRSSRRARPRESKASPGQ